MNNIEKFIHSNLWNGFKGLLNRNTILAYDRVGFIKFDKKDCALLIITIASKNFIFKSSWRQKTPSFSFIIQ